MRNSLVTCTLLASLLFSACKKDEAESLDFDGTPNEISGEWMMNPMSITGQPAGTIAPKYQFGTNSRYTFSQGQLQAPKLETGKYMVVPRPPLGFYVVVFSPDNAAEYNLELHIQSPNVAKFGDRTFYRIN